jgi:hypothetical protein
VWEAEAESSQLLGEPRAPLRVSNCVQGVIIGSRILYFSVGWKTPRWEFE